MSVADGHHTHHAGAVGLVVSMMGGWVSYLAHADTNGARFMLGLVTTGAGWTLTRILDALERRWKARRK